MPRNVFDEILDGSAAVSRVFEDDLVLAFMDIYPFSRGHTLVIPKQRVQHLRFVEAPARERLFEVGNRIGKALHASEIPCADLNFLINDGVVANQHVPHVHLHVVPRVRGDGRRVFWQMSTRFLNPVRRPDRRAFDRDAAMIRAALEAGV